MAAMQKGPAPHALQMAWMCRRFGALPEAGGLYDQPAKLLLEMAIAENVYNLIDGFNRLKPGTVADWVTANPREWETVTRLMGWQQTSD